jgi:biopolymer transport protein ExbD
MKQFDTINVIPFVDILLVLLAMVLTTATFVNNGQLDITLPVANTDADQQPAETIEIAIDEGGQHYIDANPVEWPQLTTHLNGVQPSTHVRLMIDEAVEFSAFVSVVDQLKSRQLDNVSIETRQGS